MDGLILADGTEVHLPPHLGTQLVFAVKPGDAVTIHGLHARSVPMVRAMSVRNDATGSTVSDDGISSGPGGPRVAGQALTAQGRIQEQLHGPRGDLDGALLGDGTIVHLPPPEAERLVTQLAPGAPLFVQGTGFASPLGRVIEAQAIGPDQAQLTQVAPPSPPGRPDLSRLDGAAPPRPNQR